jgi:hypothetical protein
MTSNALRMKTWSLILMSRNGLLAGLLLPKNFTKQFTKIKPALPETAVVDSVTPHLRL